jgi:NDMA-dependent alcohol dehydrogenase
VRSQAAILWEDATEWSVEEFELDPPQAGEVLVRLGASGMCHSDEHILTGDLPSIKPLIGGHEGAGVIEEVGPGVTGLQRGDNVVFGFVAACGQCPSCASGHSNLCDTGATLQIGRQMDGTSRHHARGVDLQTMVCLGTFARHTVVNQASCVKIPADVPLDLACLVGCGVTTGWGSAVYSADIRPGENVAVIGIGGIGASAVQGARLAGAERIFAIDPIPFKREMAEQFGATHTATSVDEAFALIQDVTWGRMADKVICCVGVGHGDMIASIMGLCAKRGRVVVTNIHSVNEIDVKISLCDLTLLEKQVVGSLFGSASIRRDIPKLFELYREGQLNLDDLVTRRYPLEKIGDGYQDLRDGRNIRGVLVFD